MLLLKYILIATPTIEAFGKMKGSKDKSKSVNRKHNTKTKSRSSLAFKGTGIFPSISDHNVQDTFVEPVFHYPEYDMVMTLLIYCLLAHYLLIFNDFGTTSAVFFTLLCYTVSNNHFTYVFHSPNCFLKGIAYGINTADNSINMTKATASSASKRC